MECCCEGIVACPIRKLLDVTTITCDRIFPCDGTGTEIDGPIETVRVDTVRAFAFRSCFAGAYAITAPS